MRNRFFVPLGAVRLVAVAMVWAPVLVAAQAPPSAMVNQREEAALEAARKASPRSGDEAMAFFENEVDAAIAKALETVFDPAKPLSPSPRTAWGDPDLRGHWMVETYTPLQRPDNVTKALYTPQEAIEAFRAAAIEDAGVDPATVHYDWKEFGMDGWQSAIRPSLRTSLIVDPADGKLPALTPEGRRRREAEERGNSVLTRSLVERCVTGNQGPPRIGARDTDSQIHQVPGYVIMVTQSNQDVRIIPVDGRPPLDSSVRSWLGSPSGHWEGDTLVVKTTNFHPDRVWRASAGDMQLEERFTRVDADTLLYRFTVTDPETYVQPWTVENPLPRSRPGIFEWACHEQNYGLINVVTGAQIRATEYEAGLPK